MRRDEDRTIYRRKQRKRRCRRPEIFLCSLRVLLFIKISVNQRRSAVYPVILQEEAEEAEMPKARKDFLCSLRVLLFNSWLMTG